jgi:hypothetical protein
MYEYDITLKLLFRKSPSVLLRELTGVTVERWLDSELPRQNLRVDLLGESQDRKLVHVEFQATNILAMPKRMLEYYVGIHRLTGRFPRQLCLYIGEPKLRMPDKLVTPELRFHYPVIDIRTLDGEALLESPNIGDNVIAILARLRDNREAVREILKRAAKLSETPRRTALQQLFTFAGLRHLEGLVEQEKRNMLRIDISKNKILGPAYKRAVQEGRQEGELAILHLQMKRRFGRLPAWAVQSLSAKSARQLKGVAERLLDAESLEELLQ